jgi:CHAT domain-containing protein/ATP/maltotriose-dependent transcriptional regulator MalT
MRHFSALVLGLLSANSVSLGLLLSLTLGRSTPAIASTPSPIAQAATNKKPNQTDTAAIDKAINEKRYDDAIKGLQQAATLHRQTGDQSSLIDILLRLGATYNDNQNHTQALETYDEVATIAKQRNQTEILATAQLGQRIASLNIGNQMLEKRQFDAALQVFEKTARFAQANSDPDGEVLARLKIGETYRAQQRYRLAIGPLQQAYNLARQQKDNAFTQIAVLFVLGRTYADVAEYGEALKLYQTAADQAKQDNNPGLVASIHNNMATIYQEQGLSQPAIGLLEPALIIARQQQKRYGTPITTNNIKDNCIAAKTDSAPQSQILKQFCDSQIDVPVLINAVEPMRQNYVSSFELLEANILNNLAIAQGRLGKYTTALALHQQSIDTPASKGVPSATDLNNIANIYAKQGKYPQALETYEKSLQLLRTSNNTELESTTLNNIAQVYQSQGEFKRAIATSEQALTIVRKLENSHREASILNGLGVSYFSITDYPRAQQALDRALQIYRQVGDRSGEAVGLNNLAVIASNRGDYTLAIDYQQKSLAIAKSTGDREKELATISNLGRSYADIAQYAKAFEYYEQALTISRQIQSPSWEISTLGNMASTYRVIGRDDKALKLYQQAQQQAEKLGEQSSQAVIQTGIASTLVQQRQLSEALPLFQMALKTQQAIGAKYAAITTQRGLAKLYAEQKRTPEAIAQLQAVLPTSRQLGTALEEVLILRDLAQLYLDTGRLNEAQTTAREAIALAEKVEDKTTQANALTILGAALIASNQTAPATTALNQAIVLWEASRPGLQDRDKVSLFERQTLTYRLLQKSLVAQGKTNEALEISERGRARAFVELFASRQQSSVTTAPKIAEIQAIARQQKATLVQYSQVSDRELYIWVVQPDGQIRFHQTALGSKAQSIASIVEASRSRLGVRSKIRINAVAANPSETSFATGDLRTLHQTLIAPIVADLPTDPNAPVIIVPQGSLFLVPFVALEDAQGKLLLEQHTITVAPSLQAISLTEQLQRQRPSSTGAKVVVGNPTMPKLENFELNPLPGSEREANQVAKTLSTQALIGDRATKAAVVQQMGNAPVIHLATHGLLDTIRGDVPGAIALAPSAGQDGFLTAGEISSMRLKADLVVLSACSTGKGDITGDGVIGLSRSLFLAGVPSVVVSLWDVDDASTELLMTEFYRNWQDRKLDKAQALRQAMLTTRQQFADPLNWAAFNLIGATR